MAQTTWPTAIDADDLTSGKFAKEVTDAPMEFLWKRDRVVEQAGTMLYFADQSTASAPWVTVFSFSQVWFPEHWTNTRSIQLRLFVKMWHAGGTGPASFRLKESVSGNTGTEHTSTAVSSAPDTKESVIAIGADSWAGDTRSLIIEGGAAGGSTAWFSCSGLICNLRAGDS